VNFEELLDSRNGTAMRKEQMPFGMLFKKVKDNKYENMLTLRHELNDSLIFCDSLQREAEQRQALASTYEIPFQLIRDSAGIAGVTISRGSFRTFQHLMEDTPAIVAKKGFIRNTIDALLDATERLHKKEVYHLCFAPSNVLARRSDNKPMLLFHGSNYKRLGDYQMLFPNCDDYLAPELQDDVEPSATADIYSLGRFIEFLCRESGKSPELSHLIKKATQADPEKRFQSIGEMRRSLKTFGLIKKICIGLLIAAILALIGWAIWNTYESATQKMEYIPIKKEAEEDILAPTTTEEEEFGLFDGYTRPDSISAEEFEKRQLEKKELDAKSEEIFRKYFTQDAERILSSLYSSETMSASEEKYMASTQKAMSELVRAQTEIAERAGISETRAQLLASQIIEQITARKKAQQAMRQQTIVPTTPTTSDDGASPTSSSTNLGGTGGATSGAAGTTSGTSTSTKASDIMRHNPLPSEERGKSGRERMKTEERRDMIKK
jgi:serine/threonine protein kinase